MATSLPPGRCGPPASRKSGSSLTLVVQLWRTPTAALRGAIGAEAERLAAFRRGTLRDVQDEGGEPR
ncbi:hypothetical protein [Geodermatophilus sp. CPCC 206100]|uniref:hypothetical protein n=1 Tax=Geodermatophilus sp. CPCC 206100 TaxID=3020054 RepID=UPI003B00F7E7